MNIIIVDDEKLIRQGLSFLIAQMGTSDNVIGQCKNGREALELCLCEAATTTS
ncbi:hypothetical protein [Paenibacillus anseongense]|uniref:hypothetical protein n=1 Tax=Paenibacillus anseongense TaxID=2682845 RepID=UPI002DB5CB59|nr:hypothetical protein [Paenibacillus anseongense]MEC0270522.1 hypothetical protein [Paenibacillus anseongense]